MARIAALPGSTDPAEAFALAANDYVKAAVTRDELRDSAGAAELFRKVADFVGRVPPDTAKPESLQEAAVAHAYIATYERGKGNAREAETQRRAALGYIGRVKASRAASADLKAKVRELETALAQAGN